MQPADGGPVPGSMWRVPDGFYTPLKQDLMVLSSSTSKAAATAFADYLAGDKAHAIVRAHGYGW